LESGPDPESVEAKAILKTNTDASKFANFHGGCKASGTPTVYFLAIIDTLVPFEMKKKVGLLLVPFF
jgi:hypothetical protein